MHDRITKADSVTAGDPGLFVLVMLLRLLGIGADPAQIRHRFGGNRIGIPEMLRCAKEFGLKARERVAGWERLETTAIPTIAWLRDRCYVLLGKFGLGKQVFQSTQPPFASLISTSQF